MTAGGALQPQTRSRGEENIFSMISLYCSDTGGHHRVDPVHQEDGRQVPGEKVELLQISLGLVLVLGDPGQGQEQHRGVGALLPADTKLIV